jgi:hypothetical protein
MALNPTFDANGLIDLDADQVTRLLVTPLSGGGVGQKSLSVGGKFVPEQFNEVSLTYITSGPGTGEVGTVTYKLNGNNICVLNISYDGSNRIINVVRS